MISGDLWSISGRFRVDLWSIFGRSLVAANGGVRDVCTAAGALCSLVSRSRRSLVCDVSELDSDGGDVGFFTVWRSLTSLARYSLGRPREYKRVIAFSSAAGSSAAVSALSWRQSAGQTTPASAEENAITRCDSRYWNNKIYATRCWDITPRYPKGPEGRNSAC